MFHFVALMLLFFLSCAPSFCLSLCVCVCSDKQLTWIKSGFNSPFVRAFRRTTAHTNGYGGDTDKISLSLLLGKIMAAFFGGPANVAFKATALMLCCRYFFGASCFVKCCPNRIKTFHCGSLLLLVWFLNSILLSLPFESRENVLSRLDTMLCALLGFHFPPSAITMVSWNNRNSFYCVATANINTNTKSSTLSWLFMKVFCYSIRSVSIQEPTSCAHIFRFARIW